MHEQDGRLYIYRLLKEIFAAPLTSEQLQILQNDTGLQQLAKYSSGAKMIWGFLQKSKKRRPELLCKELRSEYTRLFVGPGPVPVPIWESVYFDPEKLMFGDRTFEVRESYQKYNLQFVQKNHQPDDHLAIEIEFMCFLIQQYQSQADGQRQKEILDDQHAFLKQHLAAWNDKFLALLLKATTCNLYKGGGQLLTEFVDLDLSMLDSMEAIG